MAEFNKKVLTEPFNQAVCEWLAEEIAPSLTEKTLIFCANDRHADLLVELLKAAFENQYGEVEDDAKSTVAYHISKSGDYPYRVLLRFVK